MCEFNKDALQQKQGTASRKAIFKKYCLANAFIFCSQFKVVHFSLVSLTTETLSKTIIDP